MCRTHGFCDVTEMWYHVEQSKSLYGALNKKYKACNKPQ